MTAAAANTTQDIDALQRDLAALTEQVGKVIVGQDNVISGVITCLLAGGHGLLEGVPGLGKTLLIRTLAEAVDLDFARVQFTPDLMPADIVGTSVLRQSDGDADGRAGMLEFQPGPVFSNIVLADEINRATPKTQSALLEAMAEGTVTAAGETRKLPQPFLVLATQNPIEMEGTYPLPEAQLDRFLLKLEVQFPSFDDLREIGLRTTGSAEATTNVVMTREQLLGLQSLTREIVVAPHVAEYCAQITMATHPGSPQAPEQVRRFVRYGASPRAMQALILAGRAYALLCGRGWVSEDDVRAVAHPVLRHRMIPTFDAKLESVTNNDLVDVLLGSITPVRAAG